MSEKPLSVTFDYKAMSGERRKEVTCYFLDDKIDELEGLATRLTNVG